MLVSHDHKFIFIKTVKTGGTTTEIYLEQYCTTDIIEEEHHRGSVVSKNGIIGSRGQRDEYYNHMNAELIKEKLGNSIFNNYTKIANVRNPFDLLVSHYHFKPTYNRYAGGTNLTFNEYIQTTNVVEKLSKKARKFFFIKDNLVIDEFIRQERLNQDLLDVCYRLNLPPSNREISNYKESIERKDIHYSTFYDKKSIDMVKEGFRFYLDMFDYKFENQF